MSGEAGALSPERASGSRVIRGGMPQRPERPDSKHRPAAGASPPGRPLSPSDLPTEENVPGQPCREAPSPGVPMPADEYERLKEGATRRRPPGGAPAQEDQQRD